jgi:hypothetical protein
MVYLARKAQGKDDEMRVGQAPTTFMQGAGTRRAPSVPLQAAGSFQNQFRFESGIRTIIVIGSLTILCPAFDALLYVTR